MSESKLSSFSLNVTEPILSGIFFFWQTILSGIGDWDSGLPIK